MLLTNMEGFSEEHLYKNPQVSSRCFKFRLESWILFILQYLFNRLPVRICEDFAVEIHRRRLCLTGFREEFVEVGLVARDFPLFKFHILLFEKFEDIVTPRTAGFCIKDDVHGVNL